MGEEEQATESPSFKAPAPVSGTFQKERSRYKAPEWDSIPEQIDYELEIIRSGTCIKVLPLSKYCRRSNKGWICFGRAPDNDWEVEHPSTSRYHCVIQWDGEGRIFLYDLGSTHGTYLNKVQVKPFEYVEIHVGDQIRIGGSERIYALNGPSELLPAQGPSKEEKRHALALEAYNKRKMDEKKRVSEQMKSVIQPGGHRISPNVEMAMLSGNFDWRSYVKDAKLTEKQQKMVTRLESKERKAEGLRKENDRISSKQQQSNAPGEGFSVGQLETLGNNEKKIDLLLEEIECIEDELIESIRHSLKAKAGPDNSKGHADMSDEDIDSDDDVFYDRTRKMSQIMSRKKRKLHSRALDARDLVSQIQEIDQEKETLQKEIEKRKTVFQDQNSHSTELKGDGKEDTLDVYIHSLGDTDTVRIIKDLEKKIEILQQDRVKIVRLLNVADPEGYYSRKCLDISI